MHHVPNKVELTARFGLRPLNKAITQTLSRSSAEEKYSDNASNLSLVFVVVPNIFTSSANCFIEGPTVWYLVQNYCFLPTVPTFVILLVHQTVHLQGQR